MIKVIRPISLSLLTKLEHKSIVREIINMLNRFDLKSMYLQSGIEMLLQFHPQIAKLEAKHGKHPLSKNIKSYNKRRLELAGVISSHLQVLRRANIESQREDIETAIYQIRVCLLGIRKEDQDSITGRINNFFTEVNKDLEVKAALTRLGFQVFMDELYYTNVTFEELKGERICSISKRHTKESKTIQRECQAVLRHLFEQIELAQNIYKDKDYTLLIDALNTILAKYTKGIKRRATYNKKRAEAAAKELALSEPTTHILSVNGKETGTVTLGRMKKEEMKTTKRKRGTKSKKNPIFETQKTNVDVKNKKPILKAEEERKKINIAEGLSSATSRVSRV